MYEPMNFSQVQKGAATAAQTAPAPAPAAPAAKAAAAPAPATTVVAASAPAPAATATPNKAAKKSWCVDNVTMTFYNNKETPVEALDQFNTFVNTICPVLDLRVPSK
jgi:3-oxoacyl-ACP reductase-like protein